MRLNSAKRLWHHKDEEQKSVIGVAARKRRLSETWALTAPETNEKRHVKAYRNPYSLKNALPYLTAPVVGALAAS